MHFLSRLIETPILEEPAKNHMNIHRHFYRYSKGDFIGPAIKITKTKAKITMKGTHEYEDLILEIIAKTISDPQQSFEVKGKLITGMDLSETITNLGLNWILKKSTGKTKNYKADIVDQINKNQLLEAVKIFSFIINTTIKVTTKKNIPQPSKKKAEDDDVSKRIQFCTGTISNTDANVKMVLDLIASDFKTDVPNNWRTIILLNNYNITEIVIPKNIKDSRLLRIMAIRKGKMYRSINIDGELIEKQYSIFV